jgi:glycosyltransferase involved in cell wall biosynthesis
LLRELLDLVGESDEIRALSVGRNAPNYDALGIRIPSRHVPVPARVMYRIWDTFRWPAADGLLGGADVYHATNFFLPPVRNAKRVLSVPDASFAVVPELCSPKIVGPFAKSVPKFAREADAVLTISEAAKRDIVERFGVREDKVRVTYPGTGAQLREVPAEEARSHVANAFGVDAPFVLFVSTLEPRKNVPGLVRAFDRIAAEVPHHLVLAGQLGWNTGPILDAIDAARHADRIHRIGYTDDEALSALYCAADLFVFPSFYEGFGLPVLEAMSVGCPVVTSNNSALPEVGGDAAQYVEAGDDEALAAAITALLNDETERNAMAERGRGQAARFTWRACAEATLETYRN